MGEVLQREAAAFGSEIPEAGGPLPGNPEALLAERKRKLEEEAARRGELNHGHELTKIGAEL